jgi:hypothetical protein
MKEQELLSLWNDQNLKLEEILNLNKKIVKDVTKEKLNKTIGSLRRPKLTALILGIPYTIFLYFIAFVGYQAGGIFVLTGFGFIAIFMNILIIGYLYQLHLITQIKGTEDIITVQKQLAELRISSFNLTRITLFQLPFWSICWMSMDALKSSPFLYGGVNLLVFLALSYLAYWLYRNLDSQNHHSKIYKFFFSGREWDPILKSSMILQQMQDYEK